MAFPVGCGPVDCGLQTVAEAHGVSVLLLSLDESLCDGECSGTSGVLGRPLGVTYNTDCDHSSTVSAKTELAFIRYDDVLWPATRMHSSAFIWSRSTQALSEVEIVDRHNIIWTYLEDTTHIIEPEGGDGGELSSAKAWRVFVSLDEAGPLVRREIQLWDRSTDTTSENSAPDTSPEKPVLVPRLSELPECGEDQKCPLLCERMASSSLDKH
jgi:hypothetical protein